MNNHWFYTALLGAALQGVIYADTYTLDGTEEPDNIPNFAVNEVDAPVRVKISENAPQADTEKDALVRDGDVPLNPPVLVKLPNGELGMSEHYTLVQYNSAAGNGKKPHTPAGDKKAETKQAADPAGVNSNNVPYDWNSLSDAEKTAKLNAAIRSTLIANTKRGLNTQSNSPHDILLMTLPYGADAKVWQPNPNVNPRDKNDPKGSAVYSIGALCWNYPCAGKTLLRTDGSRIFAKLGFGYQQRTGSLLAMLSMSNIMPNYELKVGSAAYSIADLIESEKTSVSSGQNLSQVLVGLAFYSSVKEQWKNDLGETWTIEKMTTEELNRSIDQGSSDVTDWLLGLTAAVKLYESERKPVRGSLALAKKQLKTYQDFVLSVQNDQYLWHPKFFLYKGSNPDAYETLYASGHILRWLLLSLPDKELQNPAVIRSVASLTSVVNRIPPAASAGTLTDRQLEALAVSLHALSVFHQRVFGDEQQTAMQ
ncbi:MAG: hypothetical protein LBT46_07140 [Planctomycetaceae bacterium]|jgi:hypothetical protein|nr:hypothetical protein [Planctomycetaceae bacterium]